MIEVKNLTKSYKDCIAINNVDLSIPTGRFVVITGRSGSGKSTLLKCMSGLITPSDGQVLIDGHDIHKLTNTEKSKFRNTKTGYIFQSFALEPKYTAYENIELPMIIKGEKNAIRKARVYEVAGFVGISDLLSKRAEIPCCLFESGTVRSFCDSFCFNKLQFPDIRVLLGTIW